MNGDSPQTQRFWVAGLAGSLIMTCAAAQEAAAPQPAPVQTPMPMETVVITGEKLGRELKETASSVSVTTGEQLEEHGDESLYDLTRRVANTLAITNNTLSIRGVNSNPSQFYYQNSGAPLLSIYVDGVALDQTAVTGGLLDAFDLDQVEILRGPQSTSQGRNALAGAVVANTRNPTDYWEALGRVRMGENGSKQYAFAGGGPLAEGYAFRVSGTQSADDGDVNNITRQDPNWGERKNEVLRAKFSAKPAALPKFQSHLGISRSETDSPATRLFIGSANEARDRRTVRDNVDYLDKVQSEILSWRNEYAFSPTFTLVSTTGQIKSTGHRFEDFDQTEQSRGTIDFPRLGKNLSQELRLNFKSWGRFTGLAGVYGANFEDNGSFYANGAVIPTSTLASTPVNLADIVLDYGGDIFLGGENRAVFGEVDYQFSEALTLTAGLRYDTEFREYVAELAVTRADGQLQGPLPPINLLPVLGNSGMLPSTNGKKQGRGEYDATLPKLGVRYRLSPDWTLFATYSEAYRAGGAEVLIIGGKVNTFDPEFTKNYEIGFRATPLQKLDVNLNVYKVDWRDMQVYGPEPGTRTDFSTKNAGSSRMYGAELETVWRPLRGLELYVSNGYAHTEYLEFEANGINYAGNQFINAPKYTSSLGGSYVHGNGLFASASYSLSDRYYTTPENRSDERADARKNLDAKLGWQGQTFSAYVYGRNILNEDVITARAIAPTGFGRDEAGYFTSYNELRRIGAQVEARF